MPANTPMKTLVLALTLLGSLAGHAAETVIRSPADRVQLVELFTSEGCSSCPPADAWLSRLVADPSLWSRIVPVAFHVDYWDDLGWPDRFASAEHTDRQHLHGRIGNVRSVYTPGFVVDGKEWREWFAGEALPAPHGQPGPLVARVGGETVAVEFTPRNLARAGLEVVVARLGFGHVTQVERGENAGRALAHEFVVTGLARGRLERSDDGALTARLNLPTASVSSPREGLALWVTAPGSQRPLQAAGGFLPRP